MNHTCTNCGHVDEINPAAALRSIKSEARSAASKTNGAAPVKPGSRPRGRPKKDAQEWVVYCIDGRGVLTGPRTPQEVKKFGYGFRHADAYYWRFPNEKQAAHKASIVNKHMGWTKRGIANMACCPLAIIDAKKDPNLPPPATATNPAKPVAR